MKKVNNRKAEIITLVAILLSMLLLNFITPLIMDDFYYAYGLEGKLNSIFDILNFQV